jgi:methylenetetrahydrofolate dehydrogenase (NADP+)/methenyltetrahydrofolate cyclohydrolase
LTALILDGLAVREAVVEETTSRVNALADRGIAVGLATILVGEDPASEVYVRNKRRLAERIGINSFHHPMPADSSQQDVTDLIEQLNEDPQVDGILLQLPLPGDLNGEDATEFIDPGKDADGLHPKSLGALVLDRGTLTPCTPTGILRILDHYGISTEGADVVVVGRSFLVGRPLAVMLGGKGRNATVTLAHSRTRNLIEVCKRADILVAAVGVPEMITAEYVKPGATVIDVGINRTDAGLVGDVAFGEVSKVAGAITPVPKGVGPMTVAMLMSNTVTAAEARASRS